MIIIINLYHYCYYPHFPSKKQYKNVASLILYNLQREGGIDGICVYCVTRTEIAGVLTYFVEYN
ncbi:hypothetical protein D3C78_1089900 [compost metagenome]